MSQHAIYCVFDINLTCAGTLRSPDLSSRYEIQGFSEDNVPNGTLSKEKLVDRSGDGPEMLMFLS